MVETQSRASAGARFYQQFIGGEWRDALAGGTFERYSPADGSLVETIPWGGVEDARLAIDAARTAFDAGAWSRSPATQRATVLRNIAAKLREELAPMGALLSREVGKPINMAVAEVRGAAEVYDYFAALALDMKGDAITNFVPDAIGITVHEPVGVVGIITPWNFPMSLIARKLAPALAAGCTVVAKPSEFTAGTTYEIMPTVRCVVAYEAQGGARIGFEEIVFHIERGDLIDTWNTEPRPLHRPAHLRRPARTTSTWCRSSRTSRRSS